MSRTKKLVIIFSCIFAVAAIGASITLGIFYGSGNSDFGAIFGGSNVNISEKEDLDMSGVKALWVECASADIHFVEADKSSVTLNGIVLSPLQQKPHLTVSKQGETLNIKVEQDIFTFSLYSNLKLTVYLPGDNSLDAKVVCSSGDIDMSGMQFGDLTVSRSSGNLKIENCKAVMLDSDASTGDTFITSSSISSIDTFCHSGNTTIKNTAGSVKVRSTSGDIDVVGAEGAIDIGCTTGDISLDMAGRNIGPVTVNMTSGDLRFFVPKDAAFDLKANVTSGDITSDLPVTVSGALPDSFVGESISGSCNGGGKMVSLSSTAGDISIIGK
jgi:lia operon protein LiaG